MRPTPDAPLSEPRPLQHGEKRRSPRPSKASLNGQGRRCTDACSIPARQDGPLGRLVAPAPPRPRAASVNSLSSSGETAALTDEHVDVPAAVTALVDFLETDGILDPRSDSPQAPYKVAAAERAGWRQDMFDPRFMGTAKFVMLSAAAQSVDVREEEALDVSSLGPRRPGRSRRGSVLADRPAAADGGSVRRGRYLRQGRQPAARAHSRHRPRHPRAARGTSGAGGRFGTARTRWCELP